MATKSEIFTKYNGIKMENGRKNRGLGYAQSTNGLSKIKEYKTTSMDCQCPDHSRTKVTCKHMAAYRMMKLRSIRFENEDSVIDYLFEDEMIEGLQNAYINSKILVERNDGKFTPSKMDAGETIEWIKENSNVVLKIFRFRSGGTVRWQVTFGK